MLETKDGRIRFAAPCASWAPSFSSSIARSLPWHRWEKTCEQMIEGKVVRINGPIIKATGLGGGGLYDVVEIGRLSERSSAWKGIPRPSRSTRKTPD